MRRHYKDVESIDGVIYFVGFEIEYTKMFGAPTLFKVGERPLNEILKYVKIAEEKLEEPINHIYFTSNQSLNEIQDWSILYSLIDMGYYVTVDGSNEEIQKANLPDNEKLIIIISIPIVEAENKTNTYLKIDVEEFGIGNPGVWCVPLKNIVHFQETVNFTSWDKYRKDIILARKHDSNL